MRYTIRLGKLAGIDISLDVSWLVVLVLVTWLLADYYLGLPDGSNPIWRWGLAALTGLLIFVSVLAHEMAHSLVSRARGIPVPRITLYLFGGVSPLSAPPRRPRDEFWMALVGPLASMAVAGLFGVLWWLAGLAHPALADAAGFLAGTNALLALFNLLPTFPLDGGRVLRAIVWATTRDPGRATQLAVNSGILLAWAMILFGVWQLLGGNWMGGLWLALIGWFLQGAAVQEGRFAALHNLLKGHTVREVQLEECPHIFKQLSLDVLAQGIAAQRSGRWCFSVLDGERLLGLVTLSRLNQVPRRRWKTTRVTDIMIPLGRMLAFRPDDELAEVLSKMAAANIAEAPVIQGENLLGLITRSGIQSFLQSLAAPTARPKPAGP